MENLWLAILLYSIGLGLVLHFRPTYMFHANGSWKEFGYQRDSRHTLFPFWLFAITWAIVSYAISAILMLMLPVTTVATAAATASTWISSSSDRDEIEEEEEEEVEEEIAVPISRAKTVRRSTKATPKKGKPRPGYYVIDPEQGESGLRRYIYYGSEPPAGSEEAN
jgi:hypothetical protein